MAVQALAGSRSSSPSNPAVPMAPRAVIPEGAVIPPSLRSVGSRARRTPAPRRPGVHAPVDEPVRQRAMEAMARKLDAGGAATASSPTASGPTPQQLADERKSRAAGILAKAEEAQKAGDLATALEDYKAWRLLFRRTMRRCRRASTR